MQVNVLLYAGLRSYAPELPPGEAHVVECDDGATAREVLGKLGVPTTGSTIVIVNGERQPLDAPVSDGDRLAAFPMVGGGM